MASLCYFITTFALLLEVFITITVVYLCIWVYVLLFHNAYYSVTLIWACTLPEYNSVVPNPKRSRLNKASSPEKL